jgi:hypothetical protein
VERDVSQRQRQGPKLRKGEERNLERGIAPSRAGAASGGRSGPGARMETSEGVQGEICLNAKDKQRISQGEMRVKQ